jgi:hypothetical protein
MRSQGHERSCWYVESCRSTRRRGRARNGDGARRQLPQTKARFAQPIRDEIGGRGSWLQSSTIAPAPIIRGFLGSGGACDHASTEANICDGKRADGLNGPILVTRANNTGTATDVSNRVVLLRDVANLANNRTCSDFF